MKYGNHLRKLFSGIELSSEDLLFLESFQIGYLSDRAPRQEFAILLNAHPVIYRYMVSMCPAVKLFIDDVMANRVSNGKSIEENCNDFLWEIADLIIYSKYPEIYDETVAFPWTIDEIASPSELQDKVVVDAGAGSGKLSFLLAPYAGTVYAMEPAAGFRRFIKAKIESRGISNIYTVDGFLDSIPFPDNSIDCLYTSQAIGWNLADELREIERVLKSDGCVTHLFKGADIKDEGINNLHRILSSSEWAYSYEIIPGESGNRLKYYKQLHQ